MSSSDLSSISSQSEAQSSSSSSSSSKSSHYQQGSPKRSQDSYPQRHNKRNFTKKKSIQLPQPHFLRSKSSSSTSIFPHQQKKSISFNLSNQQIYFDDQNQIQQRANRGRKKSRFSNTEISQFDSRPSQSLQLRRQKSDQFQMRRKISDPELSIQPQSILKKSTMERSLSVIEGSTNEMIESKSFPLQLQSNGHVLQPSIEYILNEGNNQVYLQNTDSPKNQFLFRKDSRNSRFSQIINTQESPMNSNDSNSIKQQLNNIKSINNNLFLQSNDYSNSEQSKQINLQNVNTIQEFQLQTQENKKYQVQNLTGMNIPLKTANNINLTEQSQQSNSNYSLNNINNNSNGGNTPNTNQQNSQQLNSSINTPPSKRNSKNQNINTINTVGNNGGFSDYIMFSSNASSQAVTNVNSATTISHQNNIHRSPSQQQILNKKKDYQEVLRELIDTQDKLRAEEERNEILQRQLKEVNVSKEEQLKQQKQQKLTSNQKNVSKSSNQNMKSSEKRKNLVSIYIPFNQRMISKLNRLFEMIFHESIFIKQSFLEKQVYYCENTLKYIKNSIYTYNLLLLSSIFSLIIISKIIISDFHHNVISSSFYSSFDPDLIQHFIISQLINLLFILFIYQLNLQKILINTFKNYQFLIMKQIYENVKANIILLKFYFVQHKLIRIFMMIVIIVSAQSIHLSKSKREDVRSQSKNIHIPNVLKLVFSSYDFKESKGEAQVEFFKTNNSHLMKQYLKNNNPYKEVSENKQAFVLKKVLRFIIYVGIIVLSIYLDKIQLEQNISNNLLYSGIIQSIILVGISEISKVAIRLTNTILNNQKYTDELCEQFKVQFYSQSILFSYHIFSYFNSFIQYETKLLPHICTNYNFAIMGQQLTNSDKLDVECPEKIASYLLLILTFSYFIFCVVLNFMTWFWGKINNPLSYFCGIGFIKGNLQQFDFYQNQLRDCLLFLIILANQPLFVWSFIVGLVLFLIKLLINLLLLKNTTILNYSTQESYFIQKSTVSNQTYTLYLIFIFYLYINSVDYQKFQNNESNVCGPLEDNQNMSKFIQDNLFSHSFIGQIYRILTWTPLIWLLFISYLIKQWINKSSKSELELINKKSGKLMKQISKHYQQKIENIEGKTKSQQKMQRNSQIYYK